LCVTRRQWNSLANQVMQRAPLAFDWPSVSTVRVLRGHTKPVDSCAFAPDGSTLVTTSHDETARVWCTRDWSHLHTLTGHTSTVRSCAFAPDGNTLVTTSLDKTARVWCTRDWSHLHTLTGHTDYVNSCVFAPDGSTLITTSDDCTIRVWSDDQQLMTDPANRV
jgi:WD40 repeat protein